MQLAPNSVAWRTPVQRAGGCGGRQRRSPTGGAANGMPWKDSTPSSTTPCKSPLSTRTTADGACENAMVRVLGAAASAINEQRTTLIALEVVTPLPSQLQP